MPLFICETCDALENTATGNFWIPYYSGERKVKCECSECFTGKWHGHFEKRVMTVEEIKEYGQEHFKGDHPLILKAFGRAL